MPHLCVCVWGGGNDTIEPITVPYSSVLVWLSSNFISLPPKNSMVFILMALERYLCNCQLLNYGNEINLLCWFNHS